MYLRVLLGWHGAGVPLGFLWFPTPHSLCCLPTRRPGQWNVLHDVRVAEEHSDP